MRWSGTPSALRSIAVLVALAGLLDPAITSRRTPKPTVAVIAVEPALDSVAASKVMGTLSKSFRVMPGAFANADATVLVGDRLPRHAREITAPAFAVISRTDAPAVVIEGVTVAAEAELESHVPVTAKLRTQGLAGRKLDVTVRASGLVVDRQERILTAADETLSVTLAFVPGTSGAYRLRVSATVGGTSTVALADALVNIGQPPWQVLFYDPRPSWMSTFVRRIIEADPRFAVTSRSVTSRGISTDAGSPVNLDDRTALPRFATIVVGAPDALNDREVSGLDAFLRERGGRVILLLDQHTAGPWERLAGVRSWTDYRGREVPVRSLAGDTLALRASEIASPVRAPEGIQVLASALGSANADGARAVVWQIPVGAGQLIVNGALDAWRFRDSSVSGFARFWRSTIAAAANSAPPPVALQITSALLTPGASTDLQVQLRDASLGWREGQPTSVSVAATLESLSDSIGGAEEVAKIRLWPDGAVGSLRGTLRAPQRPGNYQLRVTAGEREATAVLTVTDTVVPPRHGEGDLLGAWVTARGGTRLNASEIDRLPELVLAAVDPAPLPERWHPMRSIWWLAAFALLLSTEWWLIRRRGGV